ncbi:MAG: putative spike protein [Prokaryotic dsDNA virus sp.]|nr:MAG: putative spike protein [Prokaryotic dsDNA virus sp.]
MQCYTVDIMTIKATLTEAFKRAKLEAMKDIATSIPGHVIAFDPVTQHAQIQIGVVRIDVNGTEFSPPPLIEVPVAFIGGGEYFQEYEINPNDEGQILFSQRCIDGWKTTGGIAQNPILRFHDYSDAVFIPGVRSQPKVIIDHANNGIRLRSKDGTRYVWLKNDGTIETTNGTVTRTDSPDGAITETNGNFTRVVNADGSMSETNGAYNKTVSTAGVVNINGFKILSDGSASSPVQVQAPIVTGSSSLVVAGKEVKDHTHDKGTYIDSTDSPLKSGNSGAL